MTRFPGFWSPAGLAIANPLDYPPYPNEGATTLASATVDTTTSGTMTPTSPADGGDLTVGSTTSFPTPNSTTLSGAMTATSPANGESIVVADASGFDASGVVRIGTETIFYQERSGTTLDDIVRGFYGTTAAVHSGGATVSQPEVAWVERELLEYHGLDATHLLDVRRPSPVAHASGAVVASSADVALTSATGFQPSGLVDIGTERLAYASISGNSLQGIVRSADGTTATAHTGGAAVDGVAYTQGDSGEAQYRQPAPFKNTSGAAISAGELVRWSATPGDGGGLAAVAEGEEAAGIALQDIADDAYGLVGLGGIGSLLQDPTSASIAPGEPVFAYTSTTLQSVQDATTGQEAVGWCLRVHDTDYDGVTALTDPRIDFVLVSQFTRPYTA